MENWGLVEFVVFGVVFGLAFGVTFGFVWSKVYRKKDKEVNTHPEFETLARKFFEEHPQIPHSWRHIRGRCGDSRTDVVCWPDTSYEVFATLRDYQIAVGTAGSHTDFEDFGRDLTDEQLAREAFSHFLDLIRQIGSKVGGKHDA